MANVLVDEAVGQIVNAFADVRLEDGVSLREAGVIDHDGSDNERRMAREVAELDDWKEIPILDIAYYPDALCFMDDKGLRFHIPAFMCFTL